MTFIDIASLIGTFCTLIGLVVAIWQLKKTRDSVDAARKASEETRKQLQSRLWITDATALIQFIEAARELIHHDELRAALIRIRDVKVALVRVINGFGLDEQIKQGIDKTIDDLTKIEVEVEKAVISSLPADKLRISKMLSVASAALSAAVGKDLYKTQSGD
ncbi:MAG: hypothetical protein IPH75_10315 [bacterium]|nr:hypothetical protein [bacterium]